MADAEQVALAQWDKSHAGLRGWFFGDGSERSTIGLVVRHSVGRIEGIAQAAKHGPVTIDVETLSWLTKWAEGKGVL